MAKREIKIGLMSYVKADGPTDTVLWGFGLNGTEVDVHASDLERFDRLNEPAPTEQPPLVEAKQEDDEPEEPPRSGRGSGVEVWTEYAQSQGLSVPPDSTRDEVIALVDDNQ